uniref:Ig-like domain-containing protein n=1 Tax=Anser brachyrhynchus TaxID=132585 RepID=A0A8B9BND9_9AVES
HFFFPRNLSTGVVFSVIGVIGEGVVLPCYVVADNIPEIFSVQWIFNEQSQKIPVSTYDGKTQKEKQDEKYQGRTEFFHSEFGAGNMSLLLKNIRSSDKGSYTCVVSFNDEYHDNTYVFSLAKGGVPSISMRSYMKQSIGLTCHADGWFPKPEVIWLDGQGQVRKEQSSTKVMMMPSGLYRPDAYSSLVPTENFEVISPRNVFGVVGLDIVLPCNVSSTKPLYDIEVQWKKITDGHIEDVYIWRNTVDKPGQKYMGRTELPKDGLASGNVSLTLKNVLPADEGMYSCIVNSKDWSADTTTMLSIVGKGLGRVQPMCHSLSHGWFPKPTVEWVVQNKQMLSPDTEIHQDSKKLFNVLSRVTVTGQEVEEVTCQIQNYLAQAEKTTVRLSRWTGCSEEWEGSFLA